MFKHYCIHLAILLGVFYFTGGLALPGGFHYIVIAIAVFAAILLAHITTGAD